MANYSFGIKPLPEVENGHVFTGDNFTQASPNTPIFAGKTGLTFVSCNMTNCNPPADSQYTLCGPVQVAFCGNLHPKWVERGFISACSENCSHVVDSDSVIIDGVAVGTTYHYADTVVE